MDKQTSCSTEFLERYSLLLEQILERLPRIQRARRSGRLGGGLRRLHVRSRCRIFLHRRTEFIKRAVVLCILRRYPCRYRLRALKLCARVEIAALLAAMQLKIALWAFSAWIEPGHQHRAAIRAARPCYRPHHSRCPRPQMIRGSSRSALRRLAIPVSFFVFFLLFGITIAAVTVLAIHKRLRPSVAPDCNFIFPLVWFTTRLFPSCIQSDCYKRPAHQSSPLKLFWNAALREQKMGHLCL